MHKGLNRRGLLALVCVLLCLRPAPASQAGWNAYTDAELQVRYKLPAGWSQRYAVNRRGAKEIINTSPEGLISLSVDSEPLRAGENISGDPAQLKRLLENYYQQLDASDNTLMDIKTRDIAVETINNLRGVVVELTILLPAQDRDGSPYLTKQAGFALLAQRGRLRYHALILCPLSKYAYNSALMNRILNEVRALDSADDTARPDVATAIDGAWNLSLGNIRLQLNVAGTAGKLRVRYRTDKGELVDVEEQVSLRRTAQGILLVAANPVHAGTLSPYTDYAPDELFFAPQADGSFMAWARDNVYVKDWQPLFINVAPRHSMRGVKAKS